MVQSREEKLLYMRQYYKDTIEERKLYKRQYRKDNLEKVTEQKAQYYKNNRDKLLVWQKQYNRNNPRDRTEENHIYYMNNRDKLLPRGKQYHKDHPEVNLKSIKKRMEYIGSFLGLDSLQTTAGILSWSKTVRKRDGHKCTWCDSTENLVAHHIWHKAWCPESALDVDNGITLCHDCHMEQHRLDKSFS